MESERNKIKAHDFKKCAVNWANFLFWMVFSPKKFYIRIMQFVFHLKPGISRLLAAFSFSLPVLFGVGLYNLAAQMAFFIISDRILPSNLQLLIYIGLGLLISLLYSLVLPGPLFRYRLRKNYLIGGTVIHSFHWSWILRRNLVFIPINLLFWIASINLGQEIWSIYSLGIYMEFILWLSLIYSLIYLWAALNSAEVDFSLLEISVTLFPNCAKKIGKTFVFSGIFIFFYLGLLIGLSFWIGAPYVPLGFKIAIILLHGQ